MKIENIRGLMLATAAAALFASGTTALAGPEVQPAKVQCTGVNACKGASECKTAQNACKGQNSCKGKGMMMMTAEECTTKGGKTEAEEE